MKQEMVKETIEIIGPDEAKSLLDHNYINNRKINDSHVAQFADMMRRDIFYSMNGHSIILFKDGDLLDGQHRLRAIIESGVALPFSIKTVGGDKQEVFETIDNCRPRQAADFWKEKYRTEVASLAKVAYAVEYGNQGLVSCLQGKVSSKVSVSRIDITRYMAENSDDLVSICGRAVKMRTAIKCGPTSAYSVFIYLVERFGNPVELDKFIDECCDLAPDSKTVSAVVTTIRNKYLIKTTKPEHKWLIGVLLYAYKNYLLRNGTKMLNKWENSIAEYDKAIKEQRECA